MFLRPLCIHSRLIPYSIHSLSLHSQDWSFCVCFAHLILSTASGFHALLQRLHIIILKVFEHLYPISILLCFPVLPNDIICLTRRSDAHPRVALNFPTNVTFPYPLCFCLLAVSCPNFLCTHFTILLDSRGRYVPAKMLLVYRSTAQPCGLVKFRVKYHL